MEIRLAEDLMEANNRDARRVHRLLSERGILTLNFISSPGAGKTTLLLETLHKLKGRAKAAVIVGDIQTSRDKERLSNAGFEAIQINTEGACHLTAGMIEKSLHTLSLDQLDILLIENVGNLVCPAGFHLGEDLKVVLLSTTEGDDKPGKYPETFLRSRVMILTKTDLIPFTNFNLEFARQDALKINPHLRIFEVSSLKGGGMEDWVDWVLEMVERKRRKLDFGHGRLSQD